MNCLRTRWSGNGSEGACLSEYPRPSLVRNSFLNLNGKWEYAIDAAENATTYEGEILVPFSPETALSGVQKTLTPGQYLHYRKRFTLPDGFVKDRVLLHFGAVDQECTVTVNGDVVGAHKGGYLPFFFDVTNALIDGENILCVDVVDYTEQLPHARGKQKLQKEGKYAPLFYTPQSGIWKTVWMESVAANYVRELRITPLYDDGAVRIAVKAARGDATARVVVMDRGRTVTLGDVAIRRGKNGTDGYGEAVFLLPEFQAWSPEMPHLYDVRITMEQDEVSSYFGMRKVDVQKDAHGILRFFVNNEPCFFNGVLDQGYWPESLLTPPDDRALVYDIQKIKEMGYNTIRVHVKVEAERFYYHCDRIGMFVWQDMPNGGGEYNMNFVTEFPNTFGRFARYIKDYRYRLFAREDETGRAQYAQDLREMVQRLRHYPSVVAWVPFNEGWGQFDAKEATRIVREEDPTRLINEACGWFDQKGGDMYSIHNYRYRLRIRPEPDRVVALTEYGGYAYPVRNHMMGAHPFGYRFYNSSEELTAHYRELLKKEIFPALARGLSAAIYTQASDIEEEINGLMTYDREVDKMHAKEMFAVHRELYERYAAATR